MNAGAYGNETSEFLSKIKIIDRNGSVKEIPASKYKMNYRETKFPREYIFLEGTFKRLKSLNTSKNLKKTIQRVILFIRKITEKITLINTRRQKKTSTTTTHIC